jgi:hypothetical protein
MELAWRTGCCALGCQCGNAFCPAHIRPVDRQCSFPVSISSCLARQHDSQWAHPVDVYPSLPSLPTRVQSPIHRRQLHHLLCSYPAQRSLPSNASILVSPWCLLLLSGRLRSHGRLHTRRWGAQTQARQQDGASMVPRISARRTGIPGQKGSQTRDRGAGSEVGSGWGRVARDDGARLQLGVGTSTPHRVLSLSSFHCGRLLLEVGIWLVGSTVAESSGVPASPRHAGAAFTIFTYLLLWISRYHAGTPSPISSLPSLRLHFSVSVS